MLERDIETRVAVETETNIREEMQVIRLQLENDENESLRFRALRPLRRLPAQAAAPENGASTRTATPTITSNTGNAPIETIDVSPTLRPENPVNKSRIKSSTTFSLRSIRKFSKSWDSAGLFDGCRHAFFNNDSEVSVYRLGDLQRRPASPSFSKVFAQKYKREIIRYVASSRSCIIVATNKRLIAYNIDTQTLIDATSHGDWDPSGLACHESETHLIVFLGQQRSDSIKRSGQIRVCRYRKINQAEELAVYVLNVPTNDYPKRFSFDADSHILTCITRLQNKLLVWGLDETFFAPSEPFKFFKNSFTAVSPRGITVPADRH